MTYLDNGATSFHKPVGVYHAVRCALENCANPGRGGYSASLAASNTVLHCREQAGKLFYRGSSSEYRKRSREYGARSARVL